MMLYDNSSYTNVGSRRLRVVWYQNYVVVSNVGATIPYPATYMRLQCETQWSFI